MALPLISCPSCKQKVHMYVSTTEKHDGWIFYRCFVFGFSVVDAIGEAEEQREQLIAAQELMQTNAPTSRSNKFAKKEASWGMRRQQAFELLMSGRESVKLMKMSFAAVVVLGLAVVVLMLKK
ncbi:hypothetical protein ZWY2020_029324 [Hordeum vulgare]|nr:hypothetical protein ZWY2020_029324 [Hordeum vulgare]